MRKGCFLGIDQGSSSTKAVMIDADGRVVREARRGLRPPRREGTRVEQDAGEILASVVQAIDELAGHAGDAHHAVLGIGLSCQRSSCLAWNASTGEPLSPVLSWRDTRGSALVDRLSAKAAMIFEFTGLPLTAYYAASKLRWLRDNLPAARRRDTVLGTLSSFLCHRLTGAPAPLIDHTNAGRTQLMAVRPLAWDRELLGLYGLGDTRLPEIVPTIYNYGGIDTAAGKAPLLASLGDQQAALFGLGVSGAGQGGINYGTGGFLMVNTGPELRPVPGLMASVHFSISGETRYLLEGSVNAAGDALDWLGTRLGFFRNVGEVEGLCRAARTDVAVFLGLNGTGAPHWENDIDSAISGLSAESAAADIVRGGVEGIAFFMADIAGALRSGGVEATAFTVSGGLSSLRYLVETQAALLGTPLSVSAGRETSAIGAAFLAGIGQGRWTAGDCVRLAPPAVPAAPLQDPGLERRYRRWQDLHRAAAVLAKKNAGDDPAGAKPVP